MKYINQIISLSKKSPQDPFKIQYKYLNTIDLEENYLPDGKIWFPNTNYNQKRLMTPDEGMYEVLQIIFNSIESYPYTWDLNGVKLDLFGFDIYTNGGNISFSPTALKVVQKHIGYEPEYTLETIYSQPDFVYAPHLTKLSIELEKTSVLSEFAIQLHSVHPVSLLSFIYESSLSGSDHPKRIHLDKLNVNQSNEHIQIKFGETIVVKRITIVLGQDNISEVIAITNQEEIKEQSYLYSLINKYSRLEGDSNA